MANPPISGIFPTCCFLFPGLSTSPTLLAIGRSTKTNPNTAKKDTKNKEILNSKLCALEGKCRKFLSVCDDFTKSIICQDSYLFKLEFNNFRELTQIFQ